MNNMDMFQGGMGGMGMGMGMPGMGMPMGDMGPNMMHGLPFPGSPCSVKGTCSRVADLLLQLQLGPSQRKGVEDAGD